MRSAIKYTTLRGDLRKAERRDAARRGGTMVRYQWRKGEFRVTTDKSQLDLNAIYAFLATESEWARGIPRLTFDKSVRHSMCFGLLEVNRQVGFARVISDRATIAYLGDVFVLPQYRGRGLAKWLMECISSHPDLQNLRRWILVTEDAHGLYKKYGFTQLAHPDCFMERHKPAVYNPSKAAPG